MKRKNMKKKRATKENQNFPIVNWAFKVELDFPDNGLILPYHEYFEEAESK